MKIHSIKTIVLLSILHFFVDFLCAYSLFNKMFINKSIGEMIIIYNYFAFVLQFPLGVLLDKINKNNDYKYPLLFTYLGIIFTVIGTYTNNIFLGLGNGLFHVGGGVISIKEDDLSLFKGRGLGLFVAPGALGLLFGKLLSNNINYDLVKLLIIIFVLVICIIIYFEFKNNKVTYLINKSVVDKKEMTIAILSCFVVVIIRSLVGMSISYPWKDTTLKIIISVFALAIGKTAGGFLCASLGKRKAIIISLLLSMICFILGNNIIFGLLSLFFFNMSMPITLYILKEKMINQEGSAFGILTLALFIGYLPTYYNLLRNISPVYLGSLASLISIILLLISIKGERDG